MPTSMRLIDFPSFIRTTDPDDAVLALVLRSMECHRTVPSAVIFHTLEEMESQVMSALSAILPPAYAIGPLPLLLSGAGGGGDPAIHVSGSSTSLSKENRACLEWIVGKRHNSVVVFASFGSLAKLAQQLVELAWGAGQQRLRVPVGDQERPAGAGRRRSRPASGVLGGDGGERLRDELVPAGGGAPA